MFECNKWDPQFGDGCVIARSPLVIRRDAWSEVSVLAAALARETLAAEAELAGRPELHRRLGVGRGIRRAFARVSSIGPASGTARLIRFDFHFTHDGWRISEANADVPGGLNEASGLPELVGPHYPGTASAGDPTRSYVQALRGSLPDHRCVALVHATAYSDDHQMMAFLAKTLRAAGVRAHLASPAHLRWRRGRAWLEARWWRGPLDAVVRFFPADWLSLLPRACGWPFLFAGSKTPLSNPASALLVQSKRFPLVWEDLRTKIPTWRALLPETRDPRSAPWFTDEAWILKPTFGRAGEGLGIPGLAVAADWRRIRRSATWLPRAWVAQRRFETVPVELGGMPVYPCLGVYTVEDRVVGAYGRIARRPLIDSHAEDAAVLLAA
jgi:hypothetical protein